MAKVKRNKNDKKLRQSIEVLKAQLKIEKVTNPVKEVAANVKARSMETDDKAIKADLVKTLILSALAFVVIISLSIFNVNPF